MHIKLYYHPHTRAFRVRWLLEELGVDYTLQYIDLFAGEANTDAYKRIHPHSALPAIEIDGKVMIETSAICHWLTDQFLDKGLAPALDDPARMQYTQWMYYVPATMEPPLFYRYLHESILPEGERVPQVIPFFNHLYHEMFGVLNNAYEGKAHLINDRFTTADLMISSVLMWRIKEASEYPNLRRVIQDTTQRSAFRRARADSNRDAA
jgi:glutathione S-transferase